MFTAGILFFSLGLQVATVVMALSLIRLSGKTTAWVYISIALILMACRRILPVFNLPGRLPSRIYDPVFETIGLGISLLMFAGVASIGPIFKRMHASERMLKASEQQFRSYFELPIIGVAIVDGERRFLAVNSKYCDLLSAPKFEIIGERYLNWVHPDEMAEELELFREMEEKKREGYTIEKRLIRQDGDPIWVSEALRCVRNADGSINYCILVSEDITNRKEAESALKLTLAEKETLLRELYHRTKNNMQIICALLEMESERISNQDILRRFQVLESRIQSMALVHDKLYDTGDLSRIDLSDYVLELAEMIRETHRDRGANISIATSLEPAVISFDTAIPCGIILNELVENAYAHAFPAGRGGVIEIAVRKVASDRVEIRVADDGIGMPIGADLKECAGMGLETVVGLSEQIKAEMRMDTSPGTAFTFVFAPNVGAHRI